MWRRMNISKCIGAAGIILFMMACGAGSSMLRPVEADVLRMQSSGHQVSLDTLKIGFKLYTDHCSGCHNLHKPKEKSRESWEALLPEMFHRTKLAETDQELVKLYLYSKL